MGDTRFIREEDIKIFDYRDLHNKTLKIEVAENARWLIVIGKDIETGVNYVLKEEKK